MSEPGRPRPTIVSAGPKSKAGESSPAFFGMRAQPPRRIPLHLGSDPGARLSLRSVRRTLGHDAERVIDPTAPAVPGPGVVKAPDENAGSGPGPDVMAADALQGERVVNRSEELLGKIRDVMIDVRHGRIAYAVLSCGGVMGFGDRLYAVPWSALTLDAERRCFVLDISRERLLAAPGFDRERRPSLADPVFARAIHAYYGQPGYWEEGEV